MVTHTLGQCSSWASRGNNTIVDGPYERGIPLYPEPRNCPAPSAARVLESFADVAHHHLLQAGQLVQAFKPELSELQGHVLELLGVPPASTGRPSHDHHLHPGDPMGSARSGTSTSSPCRSHLPRATSTCLPPRPRLASRPAHGPRLPDRRSDQHRSTPRRPTQAVAMHVRRRDRPRGRREPSQPLADRRQLQPRPLDDVRAQ